MVDVAVGEHVTSDNGTGEYTYQRGFGNEFASEAVPGALPQGRNSPQRAPLGLFTEQLSGTAFTQPRAVSRRTWVYRIMPSAAHPKFSRIGNGTLRGTPFDEIEPDPNRLRWDPLPMPAAGPSRLAPTSSTGCTRWPETVTSGRVTGSPCTCTRPAAR